MPSPTYQLVDGKVKVQIEDLLGTQPGNGWVYQRPGVGNTGAEGAHYFYRSQTAEGSHKTVPAAGHFGFSVDIEQAGIYGILLRAARDTNAPPDARNDIWIQIDGDTQSVMPEESPLLVSGGDGFVKFKGAQLKWSNARTFSAHEEGVPNATSDVRLGAGLHTIVFAPRSTGYHINSVQIIQRSVLPDPEPEPRILTTSALIPSKPSDFEIVGGAFDTDLDLGTSGGSANPVGLRFTGLELAADAEIESAYIAFTASGASAAGGSLTIQLQNYLFAEDFVEGKPLNNRKYLAETVAWQDIGAWEAGGTYRSADVSTLIEALIADGGLDALNAIAFRISGTGAHSAYAFESGGVTPELVITYVEAAEPEPQATILTTRALISSEPSDFEIVGGAFDTDLDLGTSDGLANPVGLRFTGLALDPTAEIESAYFVFTASGASAASGSLTIELQNYLSAENFVEGKPLNNRKYLAETVVWEDIGAWEAGGAYRSADISTLIEALIADSGLDALDALAFRISGTGAHSAYSADGRIAAAPELVISYIEGA